MKYSLIAAISHNGVIGKDGTIPWRLKADLRHFRKTTTGHPIIMGRRTFESIGKPLPKRFNIVVSSRLKPSDVPDGFVAKYPTSTLSAAKIAQDGIDSSEVFFIGGGQIYEYALPLCTRMYITHVDTVVFGDDLVYMPPIDWSHWKGEALGVPVSANADFGNDHSFTIVRYDRVVWP